MYLLNPTRTIGDAIASLFTFHYVSIKSSFHHYANPPTTPFTFHYVSIKSVYNVLTVLRTYAFTFHYVSIKSLLRSDAFPY